jgi:hypothetical protein
MDRAATVNVIKVPDDVEKDTPAGSAEYVHVIVPVPAVEAV